MKKIIKNPVLILVLAAMLTMTGCPSNTPDEEKLPGNWTTSAEFYDYNNYDGYLSRTNAEFTYCLEDPKNNWGSTVAAGKFGSNSYAVTKQDNYTGFKAKASANSNSSGCGFVFNWTSRQDPDNPDKYLHSYYRLIIQDDDIYIDQSIEGTRTTITDWKPCSALKLEPNENTITVFKDKDNSIVININGDVAHIITDPVLKSGRFGVICCCSASDQAENNTITAKYKFLEYQY